MAITKVSASLVDLDGGVVINESSADADFRVESNGNANMLFVDGGNDRVGINGTGTNARGGSNTVALFDVSGSGKNYVEIQGATDSTANGLLFSDGSSGNYGVLGYDHANDVMNFFTAATERMRIDSSGNVGIGRTDPTQLLEVHKSTGGDQTVAKFSAHNYGDTGKTYIEIGGEFGDGSSRIGSFNDTGNTSVLVFETHGASSGAFDERMRIDSSGNVGINATSLSKLGVTGTGGLLQLGGTDTQVRLANSILHHDNSGNTILHLRNNYGATSSLAQTKIESGFTTFHTGTSFTERMRINANGTVMVGTTTNPTYAHKAVFSGNANIDGVVRIEDIDTTVALSNAVLGLAFPNDSDATNGYFVYMTDGNGAIGSISVASGTSVSFNTTSDERLKKNIVNASPQLDIIKSVKVREFDWKINNHHELGLIAQEIKDIIPNVVTEGGDDETKNPYGVDYGKLTPYLIKAMQEQQTIIDDLKSRIETLES